MKKHLSISLYRRKFWGIRIMALVLALIGGLFALRSTMATSTDLAPGEVKVSKTAKAVRGTLNTWDIDLTIQARDHQQKAADTVLVIDRSRSMTIDSRMDAAKKAAQELIDKLLVEGNTANRVAIISFASEARTDIGLTTDRLAAHAAIDALQADGGTFTQAAIRRASQLLGANGNPGAAKNIILLSDGEPTYGYKIKQPDNYLVTGGPNIAAREKQTSALVPESEFVYSQREGYGNAMWKLYRTINVGTLFSPEYEYHYYNSGNAAIAEAGFYKDASPKHVLYSVALSAGATGESVLKQIASPQNYYTATPGDLSSIFHKISGNITAAAKNISIKDVVAEHFRIVQADGAVVTNNQAVWHNVSLSKPDASGVRTATKTVRIELSDSFSPTAGVHLYDTNRSTALFTYTDTDGSTQTKSAVSPRVNPVLIHTEKKIEGNKAAADDRFAISVTDMANVNHGHTFDAAGSYYTTKARTTGSYLASEVVVGAGHYKTRFAHSVKGDNTAPGVPGTALTNARFSLVDDYQQRNDSSDIDNDIYITVTNTAKHGSISIVKTLGDCPAGTFVTSDKGTPFTFEMRNTAGAVVREVTLVVSEQACRAETVVNGLPQGNYTITEKGAEDYQTTYTIDSEQKTGKQAQITVGLTAALHRRVVFQNTHHKLIDLTAAKQWVGGAASDHQTTLTLYRGSDPVAGSAKTITGNQTVTWHSLPEADVYGNPYTYAVKETTVEHYSLSCDTVASSDRCLFSNGRATITNTYTPPTTSHTVVKTWIGGPAQPELKVTLLRDGIPHQTATLTPATGWRYTWNNLEKTDTDGKEYVYTADEITVPVNYGKTTTTTGNVTDIINTYVSPKTSFRAIKKWVNGPINRPTIELQLQRNGTAFGTPISLTSGTETYTWNDLDKTDASGKEYVYTADEVAVPANYSKTVNATGDTITNTYTSPKIDVTATKRWIDGPDAKPELLLQLYRNGAAFGTPAVLDADKTTHTWYGLDQTDESGTPYTYRVNEVAVPEHYESTVSDDGLTITNRYVIPTNGAACATKRWIGGPTTRPDVELELWRKTNDKEERVPGVTTRILVNGETKACWNKLEQTDRQGNAYQFFVREKTVPTNYAVHYDDSGLTVVNTYVIPKTAAATATKVWVGGPADRPTIWLQLWRKTNGKEERVPGAVVAKLPNGTTHATWRNLEATDFNGNAYSFFIREVNASGTEATPTNYRASYTNEGLTVVNNYVSPKTAYTVEKVWRNAPALKPTIVVQLFRNGEKFGLPIALANGTTTHTWNNLDETDELGAHYHYSVDEVATPQHYTKFVDGNRITNTYTPPLASARSDSMTLADTGNDLLGLIVTSATLTLLGAYVLKRQLPIDR